MVGGTEVPTTNRTRKPPRNLLLEGRRVGEKWGNFYSLNKPVEVRILIEGSHNAKHAA